MNKIYLVMIRDLSATTEPQIVSAHRTRPGAEEQIRQLTQAESKNNDIDFWYDVIKLRD